jgi:hypothetical protein
MDRISCGFVDANAAKQNASTRCFSEAPKYCQKAAFVALSIAIEQWNNFAEATIVVVRDSAVACTICRGNVMVLPRWK